MKQTLKSFLFILLFAYTSSWALSYRSCSYSVSILLKSKTRELKLIKLCHLPSLSTREEGGAIAAPPMPDRKSESKIGEASSRDSSLHFGTDFVTKIKINQMTIKD